MFKKYFPTFFFFQKCSNLHERCGIGWIERKIKFQIFQIFFFSSYGWYGREGRSIKEGVRVEIGTCGPSKFSNPKTSWDKLVDLTISVHGWSWTLRDSQKIYVNLFWNLRTRTIVWLISYLKVAVSTITKRNGWVFKIQSSNNVCFAKNSAPGFFAMGV